MEEIITFLSTYGVQLTTIAILGIIILGVLKYCNLFKKMEEKNRHYTYLAISISFSIIASIIYLLIIKQFEINYILVISTSIYALNQAFYNIFKITPINELGTKLLDMLTKKSESKE